MSEKLTLAALCELSGRPDSTVSDWASNGLKTTKEGRYRVTTKDDVIRFLANRDFEPGSKRERLANAQAEKVEMENARRRGELIDQRDVEETHFEIAAYARRELDASPGRMANEFAGLTDPAVVRARHLAENRAILEGLAQLLERRADVLEHPAEDGEDSPPAAGQNGKRVGRQDEDPSTGQC